MNITESGNKTIRQQVAAFTGDGVMIYLVSMVVVMALLSGAAAVIGVTLRDNADAIVAALAGRSIRAGAIALPAPRVRVTVRTPSRRPLALQPLRAAA